MPYIDRIVVDHKERELHHACYRTINDMDENSLTRTLTGHDSTGITDFDLNTYLVQHIPHSSQVRNEQHQDRINNAIEKMNETDQRILSLMDYYEEQ